MRCQVRTRWCAEVWRACAAIQMFERDLRRAHCSISPFLLVGSFCQSSCLKMMQDHYAGDVRSLPISFCSIVSSIYCCDCSVSDKERGISMSRKAFVQAREKLLT